MDVRNRIEEILTQHPVVLFMKGNPAFPQCGFSARAIAILNETKTTYHTVDILSDPEIREGIKQYANWKTIPQLYIKKEFMGGGDEMMELYETGELQESLKKI